MTSPDSKVQHGAKDFGGWRLYVTQTMGNVAVFFGVTRFQSSAIHDNKSAEAPTVC
jgi:hypothetical protein